MRVPTASDTITRFSHPSYARTVGRALAIVLAAVALVWLMMVTAANDAAAQRGGFSRGGFSRGGGGFNRGAFGGNRPGRFQTQSGPRFGGGRGMRTPRAVGRPGRTPGFGRGARDGRPARTARPGYNQRRPVGRPGRRQATRPDGKPPKGHQRRASAGSTHQRVASSGHDRRRSGSAGDGHNRRASSGSTHQRTASYGHDRRKSSGGDGGHNRRLSGGDGHQRLASSGHDRRKSAGGEGGHNRRISAGGENHYRRTSQAHDRRVSGGHDRRFSWARPPYTVPVPPVVIYDPPAPPAPPPPAAGGGGGGSSPPPRAVPSGSGRPPVRVSRAFGGPPPSGEDRYVPDEVICVLRDDLTEAEIDQFLDENRLERTPNGRIQMGLIGVQVFRYRITDGRSVPQAISELQNDPRGISVQPNYIYQLSEMPVRVAQVTPMVRTSSGLAKPSAYSSMQYVVAKLRLRQAHQLSRGERVLIAVIDSGVDMEHPEIAGSVIKQIDVTDSGDDNPHIHGTAMTGAIVSQSQLTGVAPAARVIAIRAFAPRSKTGAHGTSFHIALAIDRAAREGARIINMSLAGPNDPYVRKAIMEARARGIILVAAAGNAGPTSPPLYPAAYPEVIAVTATDAQDRIYTRANRGSHITVSAPGVDVLVVHPGGAYGVTSGTSVAAAHISGVIALMLARNPMLDPDAVRELLTRSVRQASAEGPGDDYGAGHADAYEATVAAGPEQTGPPVATGPGPTPARFTPTQQ